MLADPLRDQLQATLGASYTLERELGGGGMSRVYVAREEALGREVVVKVLAPELAAGVSADRFAREIRLTAALQEPHIVPVLAAGATAHGLPYYTMPYVRGESLRAHVDRARDTTGSLELGDAIGILRDVTRALAYAHRRGVVHRDIKPENVLLHEGTAVVTDFGIAKALSASKMQAPDGAALDARGTLTQQGTSLGTPAYMAPEQIVGDGVDARADLYAWGVVAYELLAGRHPFAGKASAQQLIAAHIAEVPAPIGSVAPAVPAPVAAIVMRCLAKDPADRPATAEELLAALDDVPASSFVRASAVRPRRRVAAAVAGAAALAVVAAAGAVVALRLGARPAGPPLIAVLPFESEGTAPDPTFAEGLTDAVSGKLARLSQLRVIDRGSVLAARAATPALWGRALGAEYVLRATVRWARGVDGRPRAQLSTALVRVADATEQWSADDTLTAVDPLAVQAALASHVADALDLSLAPAERRQLATTSTRDTAAFAAYTRGMAMLRDAPSMPQVRSAYAEFAAAYGRDPRFADALGAGALAGLRLASVGAPRAWVDSARLLAERAVAVDSTQADAVEVLVRLAGERLIGDAAARAQLERAVRANPSSTRLLAVAADAAAMRGDSAEAWELVQRVARLAPRSDDALAGVADAALLSHRGADALELLARAERLAPQRTDLLRRDAYTAWWSGDVARSVRATRAYLARGGRRSTTLLYFLRLGDDAMRREAAAASPDVYGVTTAPDSLYFYQTKADVSLGAGDARRARALADSGWAVATRPRSSASLALMCRRCMAQWRAWLAAERGDRAEALAAVHEALDSASLARAPNGAAAIVDACLRSEVLGLLNDVDAMLPPLRRCIALPAGMAPAAMALEPAYARHLGDPRVRALLGAGRALQRRAD